VSFKVQLSPGAMADLREAKVWYEEKAIGLGEVFLDAVFVQSKLLKITPEKYRAAHRDIRRCSVRRFPYATYFRVVDDRVVVLVVHAVRQDPFALQDRLEQS